MKSPANFETRIGVLLHSGVTEMNVPSVGGAKYFVKCIGEKSGNFSACHVKTKAEAAGFLKRHACWFGRRTDFRVKKIVLDGGKEYIKKTNELEVD